MQMHMFIIPTIKILIWITASMDRRYDNYYSLSHHTLLSASPNIFSRERLDDCVCTNLKKDMSCLLLRMPLTRLIPLFTRAYQMLLFLLPKIRKKKPMNSQQHEDEEVIYLYEVTTKISINPLSSQTNKDAATPQRRSSNNPPQFQTARGTRALGEGPRRYEHFVRVGRQQ